MSLKIQKFSYHFYSKPISARGFVSSFDSSVTVFFTKLLQIIILLLFVNVLSNHKPEPQPELDLSLAQI